MREERGGEGRRGERERVRMLSGRLGKVKRMEFREIGSG